jgi:predicted nucleic-acid-binding Zn-ribbon protein
MKVNFRFPKLAVWGGIVLLLFLIGCSFPAGSEVTEQISVPPPQNVPDNGDDEDGGQTSGGEQNTPDNGDGEDGGQTAGGEQNAPDNGDGADGGQTSGGEQNAPDNGDGADEGQTSGGEQNAPDNGDGADGGQTSGGEQNAPDNGDGDDGGVGFLSWNIDYPEGKVWGAALTVSLKIEEDNFIPYKYFDLTGAGTRVQKISLPSGTYRMESHFLAHNKEVRSTEIIHIYSGEETISNHVRISGTAFPDPQEFSSVGELKEYLDSRPENTEANPYPVKIAGTNLSSKEKTGETLKTLYDVLNQRYVTLDLRECTGAELIAASTYSMSNRANIVSLILPDSIIEVNSNGFSGYTSLKSVVMPNVKIINTSAFKNCGQLESVFALELETVADAKDNTTGAFAGCTSLKTLYCPSLTTLGKYAIYGCTSLTEVAFPDLRTVGGLAFKKCTALRAVSLPLVTKIDSSSFEEASALMYLIFGQNPPELETNVFKSTDFSQTGIIYVPSSAVAGVYKNTSLPNWSNLKGLVTPLPGSVIL